MSQVNIIRDIDAAPRTIVATPVGQQSVCRPPTGKKSRFRALQSSFRDPRVDHRALGSQREWSAPCQLTPAAYTSKRVNDSSGMLLRHVCISLTGGTIAD